MTSGWVSALVTIAALAGGFIAGVWRGGRREGAAEVRLEAIAKSLEDLRAEIREDRRATNERITYLERYIWPRGRREAR